MRETSWANIRDRVVVGHFDAAHMLGPMPIASTLGIGHLKVPMVAPFVARPRRQRDHGIGRALGVHERAWRANRRQRASAGPGATPRSTRTPGRWQAVLTFAMVYPFSSHNYLLRYWLDSVGIDPDRDVRLVVIPPPMLVDAMREASDRRLLRRRAMEQRRRRGRRRLDRPADDRDLGAQP